MPVPSPRVLTALLMLCVAPDMAAWADQPAPDLNAGRAAYVQQCARCHGDQGSGDGVDAKRFYPRPRDLRMGVYKFRSTASGTPPTDEDIFRTITEGLPGSNMPDWGNLDEATRWQLVYYLKSLAPIFDQTKPELAQVAADPGSARADAAKGKALYEQLGCAACHGVKGRADGMSAGGLVDDWGKPIRPANLTKGWSYRGGDDARAVMLRVLTGIDGAGMPSYTGAVSPEDAWQLAYYVASLQEPAHWNLIAHAAQVHGDLPTAVDDPRWDTAEQTDAQLRNAVTAEGEWVDPPTITSVTFQVLVNDDAIAVRFIWDDPTQDVEGAPDRLALVLRPQGLSGDAVTLQAWPYAGGPALDFCVWSASDGRAVEMVASGYEPLTQGGEGVALSGHQAQYESGRWHLVMQRSLRPATPSGAAMISSEVFNPFAVVVWDGGSPNARAVSPWIEIIVPPQQMKRRTHP